MHSPRQDIKQDAIRGQERQVWQRSVRGIAVPDSTSVAAIQWL